MCAKHYSSLFFRLLRGADRSKEVTADPQQTACMLCTGDNDCPFCRHRHSAAPRYAQMLALARKNAPSLPIIQFFSVKPTL